MIAPRFHRRFTARIAVFLSWVLLVTSVLVPVASTHAALHRVDGRAELAHEHHHDGHPLLRANASAFDQFLHGIEHAGHCCGVTFALIPTSAVRLREALPPLLPPFCLRAAPTPALAGLFRPPIR